MGKTKGSKSSKSSKSKSGPKSKCSCGGTKIKSKVKSSMKVKAPKIKSATKVKAPKTKSSTKVKAPKAGVSKNTHELVKNVNGTSKDRYANSGSKTDGSWIDTWRKETGSRRKTCASLGCTNEATVGGHVRTADKRKDGSWGIVPICHSCNHTSNKGAYFLEKNVEIVSVRTY